MFTELKKSGFLPTIFIYIMVYLLGYFKYAVATPAILMTAATIVMVLFLPVTVFFGGDFSSLAWLIPQDFTLHLDKASVMQLFILFSLVFAAVGAAVKWLIGSIFKKTVKVRLKSKMKLALFFFTAAYILLVVSVPFMQVAEGTDRVGFYFMFLLFYVLSVVLTLVTLTVGHFISTLQESLMDALRKGRLGV